MSSVRDPVDKQKILVLIERLGAQSRGPGRVYLTGGATALLMGWRHTTLDVDLKLDPEPAGIFDSIRRLKDELQVNIELAAPDQFLPPLPGWKERSVLIAVHASVEFYHYDLYSQALAKIERGHQQDALDVREMLGRGIVDPRELLRLAHAIEADLVRYPAVDADTLYAKVDEALRAATRSPDDNGGAK
ncbi:MAG: DUF6036 family nucleotidyltransferase [Myxococcota bacterium]